MNGWRFATVIVLRVNGEFAAGELEPTDPRRYRIRHADKTIEVASIDLKGQPDDILKEVARLAKRVRAHYCVPPPFRV